MTPASMLARKRALLQLAGGAMPDTSEVDVSEVPVALPEETPEQAEPLPRPSAPVVMDEPQEGVVRDAYGDALARQRSLQLMAGLSRAGGTAIQAISGVAPDQQAASALDAQAKAPVVEYLQRMKLADTERQRRIQEARASRPAATKALPGAGLSADPDSPESRHAQEVFGLTYPNRYAPEQLARFSEQDFARLKLADKAPQIEGIETTREGQVDAGKREAARLKQQGQQFWAKLQQDAELAGASVEVRKYLADRALEARQAEAAQRDQEKKDAASVPGYEPAPGARPQPKDAETLKGINSANGELTRSISALRSLHRQYGTEYGGKGGVQIKQTMTAIKLAAKTIADLGALSGPDQGLMEDLAGGDPSTIEASAKAFFGVDNTDAAMEQLERWAENRIAAAAEARGYKPRATPTPVRVPVTQRAVRDGEVAPASGKPSPSRPDKKLDPTKQEKSRQYSADGKWLRVNYMDGTYGLAPSDKR